MDKRHWKTLICFALLPALLVSCGGGKGSASSQPGSASLPEEPDVSAIAPVEPNPEPVHPYVHPLTGEGIDVDISGRRPIAIMFNNLKQALPQIGISKADVLYEVVAEGGITRIMGVYQDLEGAGDLGSIRSARDYYVSLAVGHDAVYIHAGGSPQAYDAFDNWGVTRIDFVNGPYGDMCWRDPERKKTAGLEHSLLTSSEKILDQMPSRFRLDHEEDYEVGWIFSQDPPAGGQEVTSLKVPFSKYKTGLFEYAEAEGRYLVAQHIDGSDLPVLEGAGGGQLAVVNVLVLYTDVAQIRGDSAGRMDVRTTGRGDGLLLRDGRLYEIRWQRDDRNDCFTFLDSSGTPIPLGVGTSYIDIVSTKADVTWG